MTVTRQGRCSRGGAYRTPDPDNRNFHTASTPQEINDALLAMFNHALETARLTNQARLPAILSFGRHEMSHRPRRRDQLRSAFLVCLG
jgi:hypothetical protein